MDFNRRISTPLGIIGVFQVVLDFQMDHCSPALCGRGLAPEEAGTSNITAG
jgi:hypothetical protein